jgi:hypothetical protein
MTPPLTPAEVAALAEELQTRARIRRSIPRLEPDRIADVCERAAAALLALQAEERHARVDGRIAGLDEAYSIIDGCYFVSDAQKAIRAAIRALAASEKEPNTFRGTIGGVTLVDRALTETESRALCDPKEREMSERETPIKARMEKVANDLADDGIVCRDPILALRHGVDRIEELERENARLRAKLADVSEHAEYEQRRADGAVAELVEVHEALARILRDNGLNSDNAALARDALHTDHPLRVWDRTCPACQAQTEAREGYVSVPVEPPECLVDREDFDKVLFALSREDNYDGMYREFIRRIRAAQEKE